MVRLDALLKLPNKAVIAFINEASRMVYVKYTVNALHTLSLTGALLKAEQHSVPQMNIDKLQLEYRILEDCSGYSLNITGRHRAIEWAKTLEENGYTLYKPMKSLGIQRRLDVTLLSALEGFKISLKILIKNRHPLTVKTFNNVPEAKAFMNAASDDILVKLADQRLKESK